MLGVPVRVEIGPRDMESGNVVLVRRDTGEKEQVAVQDAPARIRELLGEIQAGLYEKAMELRRAHTHHLEDYEEFTSLYNEGEGGFVDTYWCGSAECEAEIKADTKATIRVLPFEREIPEGVRCIKCGEEAKRRAIFSKAY